ncbi:MAG TPA: GNAT family N-acetyltransferase [Tepidisphaeraceae bacterium]|jgi:CelD/BcsL family acetyltransferase involved in cellulose biosynthesis|nr:GNAT family N-acetyltransferase [Tepidisphaeraceae bacterium]
MKLTTALQYSSDYALPYLLAWVPRFGRGGAPEPMECNGLRVTCYRQLPAEPSPVLAEWDALFARCPGASAFASRAWQLPGLRRVARIGTLRLVTVSFENRLLAVLPMQKRKGDIWESTGTLLCDYLDPLVDPAVPQEQVWGAILAFCRSQPDCRGGMVLHHIADASAARAALSAASRTEGFAYEDAVTCQVSGIELPNSWDAYLAKLGGHDRKELRRKMKKAEADASAVLHSNHVETPVAQLEQLFQFMESAGGSVGRKARWVFRSQFRTAAASLHEQGLMQVGMLHLNAAPAAGLICLRGPSGPMTWGTGYDEKYKQYSPGIVTFAMTIRRAIESGSPRIDFLRGQYPYKYNLGAKDVPLHGLTLKQRTV